jgi:hypothetical protein
MGTVVGSRSFAPVSDRLRMLQSTLKGAGRKNDLATLKSPLTLTIALVVHAR